MFVRHLSQQQTVTCTHGRQKIELPTRSLDSFGIPFHKVLSKDPIMTSVSKSQLYLHCRHSSLSEEN